MLISPTVDAQLGGMLNKAIKKGVQKGVEKAVEKKAEDVAAQEVEKKLDEAIPTNEQSETTTKAKGGTSPLEAALMAKMGMNNVPFDKEFTFTSEMVMRIEVTDAEGNLQKSNYKSYFDLNSNSYAMDFIDPTKNSRGLIVFDAKNGTLLILSEENGQKSGMAMPTGLNDSTLNAMKAEQAEQPEITDEQVALYTMYRPTGNSKKVAGHNCKEYYMENDNARFEVWTTNDIRYDYSRAYQYMGLMQTMVAGGTTVMMGTVMEMHCFNKQNSEKSDFYVEEINMNRTNSLNIYDYQVIGFGGTHPAAQ